MHRLAPRCPRPKGREPKSKPSLSRSDRCGRTLSSRTQASVEASSSRPRRRSPAPSAAAGDLRNRRNGGPPLDRSRPRTRSCLEIPPLECDAVCALFFVFDLSCFAGLARGLGLVLNLAMKDPRGRRHHRRTASTPLRSATRGVRSQGAATAPSASPATLRSQQKSSPTSSNLVAHWPPCPPFVKCRSQST